MICPFGSGFGWTGIGPIPERWGAAAGEGNHNPITRCHAEFPVRVRPSTSLLAHQLNRIQLIDLHIKNSDSATSPAHGGVATGPAGAVRRALRPPCSLTRSPDPCGPVCPAVVRPRRQSAPTPEIGVRGHRMTWPPPVPGGPGASRICPRSRPRSGPGTPGATASPRTIPPTQSWRGFVRGTGGRGHRAIRATVSPNPIILAWRSCKTPRRDLAAVA